MFGNVSAKFKYKNYMLVKPVTVIVVYQTE